MRDRLGIKPLFWTESAGGVAFASEPKALRGLAAPWSLGPDRVAEYLAFRHLAEQEAMEPPIRTLLPGHRLVASAAGVRIDRWWKPDLTLRAIRTTRRASSSLQYAASS